MPAIPKLWEFTVTGRGQFAVDMLRYDQCWPATESDSSRLDDGPRPSRETRTVVMRGMRRPTIDRWKSFGWAVGMTVRQVS